jgi:hypothetical protein
MSQEDTEFEFVAEGGDEKDERRRQFEAEIAKTFAPHKKSVQYRADHPDGDLTEEQLQTDSPKWNPHNDGNQIWKDFELEPLAGFLARAARLKHPAARHPKALAHFLTHIKEWEKWELGDYDPWNATERDFDDPPKPRRDLFEWYLGIDKRGTETLTDPAPDEAIEEQKEAIERRKERLRPGGTGIIIHGEQGTTKTTAMHWFVTNIMEANQWENVLWFSSLDDTEWQVFGRFATILKPSGIDMEVTVNPHAREYRHLDPFEVPTESIAREVIEYDTPEDITDIMANRQPGHFYVVYPDPKFRQCQALTGYEYESIWDADSSDEATPIGHFWFAMTEAIRQSSSYNYWTTIVGDEAHKWLRHGKGNDEHDWWNKIEEWATYWGDARKKRMSVILAVHKWTEISSMVRDKVRWGGTMNGEDYPKPAPLHGKNKYDQQLGDMVVWNNLEWNHVGYPDLKKHFSVPADIEVNYPDFKLLKERKS